jgi:hypothetical protein
MEQPVWIALAHARPSDEDPDHAGAFVQALAAAPDADAFEGRVVEALAAEGYELLELEDVARVADVIDRFELTAEVLELALRATAGPVQLGPLHLYEDEELDESEEEEEESPTETLDRAAADRALVRVHRKPVPDWPDEGFVVGLGADWALLHLVDDGLDLDGYLAFRCADAIDVKRLEGGLAARVLEARGQNPVPLPDVALVDLRALLTSAQTQFPLVSVHVERLSPDACYIGRLTDSDDERFTLDTVDTEGRWEGSQQYALADVTRVEFGGRYEDGLALVLDDEDDERD